MTNDELLQEARRRYPVGTKFLPVHLHFQDPSDVCEVLEGELDKLTISEGQSLITISSGNKKKNGHYYTESLYHYGKWATILSSPDTKVTIELYPKLT